MDCRTTQSLISDAHHGRLAPDVLEERRVHLRACTPCGQIEHAEQILTDVLEQRLPRHPATLSLKRRLDGEWLLAHREERARWRPRTAGVSLAANGAMVAALAVGFMFGKREIERQPIVAIEAVNEHLRLLDGESPLQVQASDLHQVRPWFAGKLDFAPPVAFQGDVEYPLVGGAVSRILEQRAARFVFARRLHKISLFVLPAHGLSVPGRDIRFGPSPAAIGVSRGFAVVAWRSGEFAYVLVSEINSPELLELGKRIESAH